MTLGRFALLLILVTATVACDVDGRRFPIAPTAPTPPTAAPTPPTPTAPIPPTNVGNGTVAIRAISPTSGAIIRVRQCPPTGSFTLTTLCTDLVRATFDVQVESDIAAAGIIVGFYDESRQCGVANVTGRILIAGVTASLEAATVFLSWEANEGIGSTPQLIQPCQLPVTTTRVVRHVRRSVTSFDT